MKLEDQIANLTNPQDFNHLCDVLFADIYGQDYEQISDDQSDGGNDGFIRSKKVFYARHCFKKTAKATQKDDILKKFKSDLSKVKELQKSYDVCEWMFVSSYRMPNDARAEAQKIIKAENTSVIVGFVGPAYLASELLKRPHLLPEFSFLHINRIEDHLESISESIASISKGLSPNDTNTVIDSVVNIDEAKAKKVDGQLISSQELKQPGTVGVQISSESEDFKKLTALSKEQPSLDKNSKIKTLIYTSADPLTMVQGVFALISDYKYSPDTISDMLSLIDIGIDTARSISNLDAEALLQSVKGDYLSTQFCLIDLEAWGRIRVTVDSGIPLITEAERQKISSRLTELNLEFSKLFKEAYEKAFKTNNYLVISQVFSAIGSAAGARAGHFKIVGVEKRAILEEKLSKGAYMYAKSVCVAAKDEIEEAFILYNFANSLGFMGQQDEALGVLEKALEIAMKHKITGITTMVDQLKKSIRERKEILSSL